VKFTSVTRTTGDGPRAIAAGDVDGDGNIDLAVANAVTNDVAILQNLGNGSFADAPQKLPAGGFGPSGVAVGDWNGDGRQDLAVANNYSGKVALRVQNADGSFSPAGEVAAGTGPSSIVAADLDGDGDLDLAVTNEFNNNVALLRNEAGKFSPAGTLLVGNAPQGVTAADVNGDGRPDLIVANFSSRNVSLLRNTSNGSLSFAAAVNMATGYNPFSVTTADVNGDGHLDLISANVTSDDVSVLRNRGDGTFFPSVSFAAGLGPTSLAAADLDRDGDLDLAVGNATSEQLSVLINDGHGGFGWPLQFVAAKFPVALPYALIVADFDGDGDADLAMTNGQADAVSVLLTDAQPGPQRVTLSSGQTIIGLDFGNGPPNMAPQVAQPIADQQAVENKAFTFTVAEDAIIDPDVGDELTYTARLADGGDLPKWLSFDTATRTFSGKPPLDANATDDPLPVVVVATDRGNLTAEAAFTLLVRENPRPWQNPRDRLDVLPDGNVTPADVLAAINFLNAHGAIQLPLPPSAQGPPPYLDVDGDGWSGPRDVLAVINYLNGQGAAGEGERHSVERLEGDQAALVDEVFADLAAWD